MACSLALPLCWVVVVLIWTVPSTRAAICFVSTTGNAGITDCTNVGDPCRDFLFAIESAVPTCTDIFAFPGLYTGLNNTNIMGQLPLVLKRFGGGDVTVDLQGNGRFLSIVQLSSAVTNYTFIMQDMELRGAAVTQNEGGAVFIQIQDVGGMLDNATSALFENVQIRNCTTSAVASQGGGLRVDNLPVILRNVTVADNSIFCSDAGGPICCGAGVRLVRSASSVAEYLIEDSLFIRNQVTSFEDDDTSLVNGGGLSFGIGPGGATNAATAVVRRSSFMNNSVVHLGPAHDEARGGAISAISTNLTIECPPGEEHLCTFSGNSVFSTSQMGIQDLVIGGAVSVSADIRNLPNTTFLTIRNAIFFSNQVTCANASMCATQFGGGALASARISISGCSFCNNSAPGGSGDHILVLTTPVDTSFLMAGPLPNVFTCNNTAPAIQPLSFECGAPDCLFPPAMVDPLTGVCEPCAQIVTSTPTPSPTPTGKISFLECISLFFALARVGFFLGLCG